MNTHPSIRLLTRAAGAGIVLGAMLAVIPPAAAEAERWYGPDQVQRGAAVFAQNCAECHGANAEATPDWRKVNPDGKYPPPPLDGSAHAWHHPLDMLRLTVRRGGAPVGGLMPPFEDKLSAADIDAAIAFFQSKWPGQIYAAWEERNGKIARAVRTAAPEPAGSPVTARLRQRLPQAGIGEPESTPVPGIYQVKLGSGYAYVTADGRYAFVGDLVDLEQGVNLTDARRNRDTRALVEAFQEKDMVVYPATGEERARITVFTDTSCPFCRRLHQEVPALQQAGVRVRYVAFPRAGLQGETYRAMRSVWCAADRRGAMDAAKGADIGDPGAPDCAAAAAVDAGFRLGLQLGIQGTPAMVLPDGSIQSGYLPATGLLARLGILPRTGPASDKP